MLVAGCFAFASGQPDDAGFYVCCRLVRCWFLRGLRQVHGLARGSLQDTGLLIVFAAGSSGSLGGPSSFLFCSSVPCDSVLGRGRYGSRRFVADLRLNRRWLAFTVASWLAHPVCSMFPKLPSSRYACDSLLARSWFATGSLLFRGWILASSRLVHGWF